MKILIAESVNSGPAKTLETGTGTNALVRSQLSSLRECRASSAKPALVFLASSECSAQSTEYIRQYIYAFQAIAMSSRMATALVAGILGDLLSASPLTRSPSTPLDRSAIVDLGYSRYQGVALANGVDEYLGMRYARPPLNELRFRGPEDPELTDEIVDATAVSSYQLTVAPEKLTSRSSDPSVSAWVNERVIP